MYRGGQLSSAGCDLVFFVCFFSLYQQTRDNVLPPQFILTPLSISLDPPLWLAVPALNTKADLGVHGGLKHPLQNFTMC